ncbi:MAG: hypothetical protein WA977_00475 [Halobacteriota archaeon]
MSEEEFITLDYRVDLRGSGINEDEAIPLVKQAIEEVKEKYPEKAKDLEKIEIKDAGIRETQHKLSVDAASVCLAVIFSATLRAVILETWKGVVIPYLQKRLKLEEYKNE